MPPVIGKPPVHTHAGAGQGGALPSTSVTSHDKTQHAGDLATPLDTPAIGVYLGDAPLSAIALVADRLYGNAFWVPRLMTFDRIGIEVQSAGAGGTKIRLGIYQVGSADDKYPGALVLDAGTVDADGTGVKAITIEEQLSRGWYYLACVTDGTPSVRFGALHYHHYFAGLLGGPASLTSFISYADRWLVTFSYAALPDPFTAGGSLNADGGQSVVGVLMRSASIDD